MTNLLALQPGTELVSDYRIDRVLGAGGFGITYLADELALDRRVTIKEYFPSDYAARSGIDAGPRSQDCDGDYRWGLDRFIAEAQTLAKFTHPNIVRVYRYFRANNTGYMVLHFEEGQSFKSWLRGLGRAPRQRELDKFVPPLLDALETIHKADFLHRDIAPDNIIIRNDGVPVLIDFGAARGEVAAHSKTISALVKPGYSPYEQYAETSKQQGPWSDIYALGATLYHAVTGRRPPDAPSRMVKDEIVPAREAAISSYRHGFLAAIDKALALNVEARPRSVAAWRGDLLAPDPPKPSLFAKSRAKRDAALEPALAASAGALAGAVPPPPDAPGRHGGMLDFIDGLKPKSDPAPAAAPAPTPPAPEAPASPRSATVKMPPTAKAAASAAAPATDEVAPAAPAKMRPQRPRKILGERGSWRPLVFKLLIGAAIASVAVALQDKLPTVERQGASTVTSQQGGLVPLRQIKGHRGAAVAVIFTEDGRSLVSAGQDATVKIWNAASGSLTRTIELDNGAATALAISGRRMLTGHGEGTLALWDLDRGDKLGSFRHNDSSIWSVAFVGDGRFAAAQHDGTVAIWDAKSSAKPVGVLEGHESAVQALAFSAVGPYLASGGADKTLKLWSVPGDSPIRTYRGHKEFISALASNDGKVLASAALDGTVRLWSTASSRLHRNWSAHKGKITGLAFSPSGEVLVTVGDDGMVKLWDAKRGKPARLLVGHAGGVRGVSFAPDGKRVASAGDDGTIRLWDGVVPKVKDRDRD